MKNFFYILLVLGFLSSCQPKKVKATQENIEAILMENFSLKYYTCGCFGCVITEMKVDSKKETIDYKIFSDTDSIWDTKQVIYSDKKRKIIEEFISIGSEIDSSKLQLCTGHSDYRIYNKNIEINFQDGSCSTELQALLKDFLE